MKKKRETELPENLVKIVSASQQLSENNFVPGALPLHFSNVDIRPRWILEQSGKGVQQSFRGLRHRLHPVGPDSTPDSAHGGIAFVDIQRANSGDEDGLILHTFASRSSGFGLIVTMPKMT